MVKKQNETPIYGLLGIIFAALGYAVFGIIFESLGLIFSCLGLAKEKQIAPAIIGLVLSIVGLVLAVLMFIRIK